MDSDDHKNTWNNFTKFVLWGTVAVIAVLVLMAIFLLQSLPMRIGSVTENKNIEKRIAITPEIVKKYISLGFEIFLSENYGSHIGIEDQQYLELGVKISKNETEILNTSDIIVQLGMLTDDKSLEIKENQTLIGILNPYDNKDKLENLAKKKN